MLNARHRKIRKPRKIVRFCFHEDVLRIVIPLLIGLFIGSNCGYDPMTAPVPYHPMDERYATPLKLDSPKFWKECDDDGLLAVKRHATLWGKNADMSHFRLLLRSALKSIGRSDPQLDMNELYVRRIYASAGGDVDAYYGELVTTFGFWHDGRHDPFGADARKDLVELVEKGMSIETLKMYVQVGASHNGLHMHLSRSSNAVRAHYQIRESQRLTTELDNLRNAWFVGARRERLRNEIRRRLRDE